MTCNGTAFLTIVTHDYYYWAKTWAESVRENHNGEVIIVLADKPTEAILDCLSDFRILTVPDLFPELGIENYQRMAFQYTPFELTCALKPFLMRYLHSEFEQLIYLDADTFVYRELAEIPAELESKSILLTPHLLVPDSIECESRIRAAGTINGGFLATRQSGETISFLDWWCERCRFDCIVDPYSGHFVDQSWLDLAASFFQSLKILRDDSLNVAYWNVDHREIIQAKNGFTVNGKPLGFFHFSGLDLEKPDVLSRFDNRVLPDVLLRLSTEYRNRLLENRIIGLEDTQCQYATFDNGLKIDRYYREAIRNFVGFDAVENPFDLVANPELIDRFEDLQPELILARKHWQMEELQKAADRQTEWIQKQTDRRLDRKVFKKFKSLYFLVSNTLLSTNRDSDANEKAA
ncbi:MAG: hypothetical protein VX438_12170 [Planctomycetota bacterium]|nr:hypothetical protein [Planctomycetota bacterium]